MVFVEEDEEDKNPYDLALIAVNGALEEVFFEDSDAFFVNISATILCCVGMDLMFSVENGKKREKIYKEKFFMFLFAIVSINIVQKQVCILENNY